MMQKHKNFNIRPLCDRFGLKYVRPGSDSSAYYKCPFCGSKVFNVNFEKNTWRCNKCQEGGGVKAFIKKVGCLDEQNAEKCLNESMDENEFFQGNTMQKNKIADEKVLDETYRAFLGLLKLKEVHRQDLIRRGFSDKAIDFFGFKSLPNDRNDTIPAKLIRAGCNLIGVPGFYQDKGIWRVNCFPTGYLVPFVNINGYITGFQVRNDAPTSKHGKYMSFTSTGKNNGTQSKIPSHLIGYEGQDTVYLTEGALKADAAHYLMYKRYGKKVAFLAIPGVNNTSSLKIALKKLKVMGVKNIVDAFDMDKLGNNSCEKNSHVEDAVKKIETIIHENKLNWKQLSWAEGKGIDDFMLLCCQKHGLV